MNFLNRHVGVLLLLASLAVPASAVAQSTTYLGSWAAMNPWALAIGADGLVYVEVSNGSVGKYSPSGNLISQWGGFFVWGGLASDNLGRIYASDYLQNGRVRVFSSSGVLLGGWPCAGASMANPIDPRGIAVDRNGNVYVAGRSSGRIQKYTSTGTLLAEWGDFPGVWGLAVDQDGFVYAADQNGGRVLKFTSDGVFVRAWGQMEHPTLVAVGMDGFVYVSEYIGCRVSVFTTEGDFVTNIGGFGTGPSQFSNPTGLAMDAFGVLYVADLYNNRVQVFGPTPTGSQTSSWGRIKTLYR